MEIFEDGGNVLRAEGGKEGLRGGDVARGFGGEAYVQRIIDHMTDEEIEQGLHFFKRVSEIVESFR